MPSTHAKLLPDKIYHVYNRGNNKQEIFFDPRNYHYFLTLWAKYISPIADTLAYCLLKNHFHFLIRIKGESELLSNVPKNRFTQLDSSTFISRSFSNLFNAYSKAINKGYNRTGSLFQERFRRKEIDSEAYFTEVIFYIHGNPQKHGLISDFREYKYSSYQDILNEIPSIILKNDVLQWYGGKNQFIQYHTQYREALSDRKIFFEGILDDD